MSVRDDAYIALCVPVPGKDGKFTLRQVDEVSDNGRKQFYSGSNKATDAGALTRAIRAGRVVETSRGNYALTKMGKEQGWAALKAADAS